MAQCSPLNLAFFLQARRVASVLDDVMKRSVDLLDMETIPYKVSVLSARLSQPSVLPETHNGGIEFGIKLVVTSIFESF